MLFGVLSLILASLMSVNHLVPRWPNSVLARAYMASLCWLVHILITCFFIACEQV